MIIRAPFKFLYIFLVALAASVLLLSARVSADGVMPPPKPGSTLQVKIKIQPGEALDKNGYAKKSKPSLVEPKPKLFRRGP